MASTNKTEHYDLSQFVPLDKPAWLGDYNSDMQKIDAGIYAAKTKADSLETNVEAASAAASAAQQAAQSANEAAQQASDKAQDAETTANGVSATASQALTTAQQAQTAAEQAETTATQAQTTATTARKEIPTAISKAFSLPTSTVSYSLESGVTGTVLFKFGTSSRFLSGELRLTLNFPRPNNVNNKLKLMNITTSNLQYKYNYVVTAFAKATVSNGTVIIPVMMDVWIDGVNNCIQIRHFKAIYELYGDTLTVTDIFCAIVVPSGGEF